MNILSLTVSAIIVDTLIGYYLLLSNRGGKYIKEWYNKFRIGAYFIDILSIVIGTYLATLLSSQLYIQIILVIVIGLIHDLSFGFFLNKTNTTSSVLNIFKKYAKELGTTILIVDSAMLVSTLVLSNYLNFSVEHIVFLGIVTMYLGLLMVYSF